MEEATEIYFDGFPCTGKVADCDTDACCWNEINCENAPTVTGPITVFSTCEGVSDPASEFSFQSLIEYSDECETFPDSPHAMAVASGTVMPSEVGTEMDSSDVTMNENMAPT